MPEPQRKYQAEIEWLFRACESEMGLRSNFSSFLIASKIGTSRTRIDIDTGDLVNGAQEDVESDLIDEIDSRRAASRLGATAKNRRIMAAYTRLSPAHQRVFECAYEARHMPPEVRQALGDLAGVVPLTPMACHIAFSRPWLARAIAKKDPRVATLREEAEWLFAEALGAYGRARAALEAA